MEINEINLGKYQINEDGILKYSVDKDGEQKLEVIFPQQIYPNAIIHNITTDNEKLSLNSTECTSASVNSELLMTSSLRYFSAYALEYFCVQVFHHALY